MDPTSAAVATTPGPYPLLSYADLKSAEQRATNWLWQGYLVPGGVTVLTSQWKAGKSTLISVLLARMKAGGLLAGLPVRWLDRVVKEGRVLQDGLGTRREPYLYRLPGMVEKWQAKFMESFLKQLERGPEGTELGR
jgi:hypothetical protein